MNEVAGATVLVQTGEHLWDVQITSMKCNPPAHFVHHVAHRVLYSHL